MLLRHLLRSSCVGAIIVMTAGCGGGSSKTPPPTGVVTPAPTPTPTPTPAPTPSPTPSPAPTPLPVIAFDFAESFALASNETYSFAYFKPKGGTESFTGGRRSYGQAKLTWDVRNSLISYTYPDTALESLTSSYGSTDLTMTTPFRVYQKGSDKLIIERIFDHILYVGEEREAEGIRGTATGTVRGRRIGLFYNAAPTGALARNLEFDEAKVYVAGGTVGETPQSSTTARSTAASILAMDNSVRFSISITETRNGDAIQTAALRLTGQLNAQTNVFEGNVLDSGSGFSGKFSGTLVGPDRNLALYTWDASHTDGRFYTGSFFGRVTQ